MELRFPLILDGATGTELQKRGYTGDVCAEQWTLDHPDAIIDIQRGYVAAGSQVVYTPTFGANRRKLEESGLFNCTAYTYIQQRQAGTPQQADTRNKGNCQQCHRQAVYLTRGKHPISQCLGAKGIPCIDLMLIVKIITPGIPGSVKHNDVQQCPDTVHPVYVLPHPIQICQRHHHRHRRGGE